MIQKEPTMDMESFIAKLNSDTAFRNKFLDYPVDTLRESGFSLGQDVEEKIEAAMGYLKEDIRHIFEIPSGSSDFLEMIGFGLTMPPEIEVEPDIKIT